MSRPDILIAIPGRQHADQLALALLEAGWNPVLHHGAPVRRSLAAVLRKHTRFHRLLGLVFRTGNRLLPPAAANRLSERVFGWFDRLVAPQVTRDLKAVIGYESGCLHLFQAARRQGLPTILDAASVHHRRQAASGVVRDGNSAFRIDVNERKSAEIALADAILCCSTLAKQSYIDAGVPFARVHAEPLGFDPGLFAGNPAAPAHEGRLRIAFVGRFTAVKGADILADVLARLADRVDCRIAASRSDGDPALAARLEPYATLLGKLPQAGLADLYAWADVLVMPSRFDSFGLVVPEALACGLPVVASDHVGASDQIRPGVNGEIVPANDADTLFTLLDRYAADPTPVRAMRGAALASARGAEWPAYRARVAATVGRILQDHRPA